MSDRIEFVRMEETCTPFTYNDRWEFKPRGKFGKVLSIAFNWAVKHGYFSNAIGKEIKVTRHVINPDSVVEMLFAQRYEVLRYLNRDASTVIMGSEDFSKLMGAPEIMQYMTFNAVAREGREILGMKIKIVPWMRGVVVVP